jgi:quercetin dioxygenase-like cupin family protein
MSGVRHTDPREDDAVSTPSTPVEVTVVDTNMATWELFPVDHINANLEHVPLLNDEETGMMIVKMVYRAGFTNPWHSHSCGHGFYVLEGTLKTHRGEYPAGSFVWFPEGGVMEHGATQDEDVTFLFITNKGFDIHFVGDDSDPDAPTM